MKLSLFLGALLTAIPCAVLSGCSGGAGNSFSSNNPTNPPTTGTTAVSNLTLGKGQRAILTTINNGGALTGTLQIVPTPIAAARQSSARQIAALPFQFAFGSYKITGTVSNSGAFTINGDFGAQGQFSMTGQLATTTTAGSYTLKVNGQTDTGVLPKVGTTFPPPPSNNGNYNLAGKLTFSDVSAGSEVVATPITSFNDLKQGGILTNGNLSGKAFQSLSLGGATGRITGDGTTRLLQISLSSVADFSNPKPFSVGQIITLNPSSNLIQYSQSSVQGTSISIKVWRGVTGKAIIKAIASNSATVELKEVRVDPSPIFGGKGSFMLNGTLTATGLQTKTQ